MFETIVPALLSTLFLYSWFAEAPVLAKQLREVFLLELGYVFFFLFPFCHIPLTPWVPLLKRFAGLSIILIFLSLLWAGTRSFELKPLTLVYLVFLMGSATWWALFHFTSVPDTYLLTRFTICLSAAFVGAVMVYLIRTLPIGVNARFLQDSSLDDLNRHLWGLSYFLLLSVALAVRVVRWRFSSLSSPNVKR